ncbi:MAG: META domain-containing protein, partial [Cyclobacteriaceae bacterium]
MGMGNEPFWNLKIDKDKLITFKMMDGPVISIPAAEPIRAQDANVLLYRGSSDSGTLEITLNQASCQDSMSGIFRPFRVRVRYKTNTSEDFTELEGCGNYVANPRLHNIWIVMSLNNQKLDPASFPGGLPRLELFTAEGRVMGFDGCNSFNGSFYEKDDELYFSPMISTLKACPGIPETGRQSASLLSGKRIKYEWTDSGLILHAGNQKIHLRNAD